MMSHAYGYVGSVCPRHHFFLFDQVIIIPTENPVTSSIDTKWFYNLYMNKHTKNRIAKTILKEKNKEKG